MFASSDFAKFTSLIRDARTPSNVVEAWLNLPEHFQDITAIVSLPDHSQTYMPPGFDIRNLSGKVVVKSFFAYDSLYFISRKIIEKTFRHESVQLPIDGSIMLDTNIASYLSTYINRKSFGNNQGEIVNVIEQLLANDTNYDYIFYLVENTKKIIDLFGEDTIPSIDVFWESMDYGFKQNLISLRLFLSIDHKRYKTSHNDQPTISTAQAESEAKNYSYNYYFGSIGRENYEDNLRRYRTFCILVYKIAAIQLGSNEGIKKKTLKLLEFMTEELGAYFDREMYIAIKYFREGKNFTFFRKIDKGQHIDLAVVRTRVENMAWDLMIPRHLESLVHDLSNHESFFIPHYLTFDKGLSECLDLYKAKAVILGKDNHQLVTLSEHNTEQFLKQALGNINLDHYFNISIAEKRYKQKPTDAKLKKLLLNVQSELSAVIHS